MHTNPKNKTRGLAALGAAALLALTGCSQSGGTDGAGTPGSSAAVFEFQTPRYGSDSGELTVNIPEGLVEAMGDDSSNLLVSSARVTPRKLEGATYCAIDVVPVYVDGTKVISAPSITKAQAEAKAKADTEGFLAAFDADSVDDAVRHIEELMSKPDFDAYYGEDNWAAALNMASDSDSDWVGVLYEHAREGMEPRAAFEATISDINASFKKQADDASSLAPSAMLGERLTGLSAASKTASVRPSSELDESRPEEGVYAAADGSSITYVQPCAVSPSEDSPSGAFKFPVETSDGVKPLASVELTVMKSGTLTITSAEINGFTRDTDGNWIAG